MDLVRFQEAVSSPNHIVHFCHFLGIMQVLFDKLPNVIVYRFSGLRGDLRLF